MNEAIAIQLSASMAHQNRANIFQPADARFFEMYFAGKDSAIGQVVGRRKGGLLPHAKQADEPVVVDDVQTREYAFV